MLLLFFYYKKVYVDLSLLVTTQLTHISCSCLSPVAFISPITQSSSSRPLPLLLLLLLLSPQLRQPSIAPLLRPLPHLHPCLPAPWPLCPVTAPLLLQPHLHLQPHLRHTPTLKRTACPQRSRTRRPPGSLRCLRSR